ncbi:MAG: hypothetical protein H6738_14690 [Alphaproteobacteria bacterium]|nr:hypothetical protein [Alphaproteobacteria bacterium]MCB9698023.1 hypothetical protein [Alphaproteobacteria bacterium]
MNARGPIVAVLFALLAGAVLVAILWVTTPSPTPPPVNDRRPSTARSAPVSSPAAPSPSTEPDAATQAPPDLDAWRQAPDPATHREFDTPEEAEAFVTRNVTELFAVVWPEIDPATITAACTVDGRHCTYEGPWPGDDFLKRWLVAISEGRTGPADMEGVTFSTFRPEERGEERIFVLEAHAP